MCLKSLRVTFRNWKSCCRNLAIGIGIQNFPEGLAVSLPLQAAGISTLKSFWYGQLSGMVEPIAGVLGAAGVTLAAPALPYALAFAAGAMIYVVIDDIIPEAHQRYAPYKSPVRENLKLLNDFYRLARSFFFFLQQKLQLTSRNSFSRLLQYSKFSRQCIKATRSHLVMTHFNLHLSIQRNN